MKKLFAMLMAAVMVLSLTACAAPPAEPAPTEEPAAETVLEAEPLELIVFAAASMTETLNQIAEMYKAVAPNVTLIYNFDSSGTLKTQIQE
ncbi:MAG: molybdate ABC transporter substrate-binding protein, partial [Eubacteriales bacterium]|nr:molybdate ABC transporter substrate-binding protein [Eubacteriales bacterium]